ncbi:hypothetical protein [Ensifer soli]|uniref:hypothetical protein n=1 Tax=Ciceribacter sp. sgz301302 TaxID=3342379 RepID=UPI0035B7B397
MSLINVFVRQDSVSMFSDTRLSIGSNRIGDVAKVFAVPHLNAVIGVRGPMKALQVVVDMVVPLADDFKGLRAALSRFSELSAAQMLKGNPVPAEIDIFVAGWNDGPVAYFLANHDGHGIRPFRLIDIPYALVTPRVDDGLFQELADEDPEFSAMRKVIDAQVATYAVVGGAITCTTIHQDQITMRRFSSYHR